MSNLQSSLAFRARVLLFLHSQGFPGLTDAADEPALKLSELIDAEGPLHYGDILGLPWTLGVRNQRSLNLGAAMNEVEREAEGEGCAYFASIQSRSGHSIGESYVTMPLSVFAKVLHRLHPELTDDARRSAS